MDEGLYAAARAIRWFLPDLIGPAAEEVDAEIAELLTRRPRMAWLRHGCGRSWNAEQKPGPFDLQDPTMRLLPPTSGATGCF